MRKHLKRGNDALLIMSRYEYIQLHIGISNKDITQLKSTLHNNNVRIMCGRMYIEVL